MLYIRMSEDAAFIVVLSQELSVNVGLQSYSMR
jgi:hypothetical protein